MVFLGLLGTFWGLLQTISSVSNVINTLDMPSAASNENMFNKAKNVWVIDTKNSLSVKPSNQEAYKTYQEILSIIFSK